MAGNYKECVVEWEFGLSSFRMQQSGDASRVEHGVMSLVIPRAAIAEMRNENSGMTNALFVQNNR